MSDIDVAVAINTAAGWLELEDEANGYELEASTRNEESVTWRKRTIEAEWVEGGFTVAAVKANVVETVAVWVAHPTSPFTLEERIRALTDGFEQLRYTMRWVWGDLQELWNCQPADYRITRNGPYMAATKALVTAQVPRLPSVVRSQL